MTLKSIHSIYFFRWFSAPKIGTGSQCDHPRHDGTLSKAQVATNQSTTVIGWGILYVTIFSLNNDD